MSDHIRSREQISGLGAADHSAIFPDTPEDSDLEDSDSLSVSGAASTRHRDLFPHMLGLGTGSRNHSGALYILSRSKKQFQVKWCVLGEGKFSWFNEDTSLAIPKESFLLTNIFSVTKKQTELGPQSQDLFCFDLAVLNSKGKFAVYVLGALSSHER